MKQSLRLGPTWSRVGSFREVFLALAATVVLLAAAARAQQLDPITEWATNTSYTTGVRTNVVYQIADSRPLHLDVLTLPSLPPGRPVVIYFHGGGWVSGDQDGVVLKALPYLARGMDVVTVQYRLASQGLAPAAVEDGRCALHWVARHAKEYGFDTSKIVTAGESAGGHLALMTGMLAPADGYDYSCEVPFEDWQLDGPKDTHVAAILNFFGPIDLDEYMHPAPASSNGVVLPMPRNFVLRWIGDQPNRFELAKQMSPINYVRKAMPPILSLQGDMDPYVPHSQAVRLHELLDGAGVRNRLVTIQGGGHGSSPPHAWTVQQNLAAQTAAFEFLRQVGVLQ